MIKKLLKSLTQRNDKPTRTPAQGIPPRSIPTHVLSVVDKLSDAGYEAYLVGGCVRDLLTQSHPKDFDVATNATPQEVRKLFRNSRLIGRRFVLVHVYFGKETVEVATFRGDPSNTPHRVMSKSGQILQDNAYGTIEEDAMRRDFTINALFYDPRHHELIDFTQGLTDIRKKKIRLIGDPATRYREDPMRMLRALRFSAKLGFDIDKATDAPMRTMGAQLLAVPPARLFEETMKLFMHGYAVPVLNLLRRYGFDRILFTFADDYHDADWSFIVEGLTNTDERFHAHLGCSTSFLIALLCYPGFQHYLNRLKQDARAGYLLKEEAMQEVLRTASQTLHIPKRITAIVRGIWHLQYALVTAKPHQVDRIANHPQFRPALDLLRLRSATHEPALTDWVNWWTTRFAEAPYHHD